MNKPFNKKQIISRILSVITLIFLLFFLPILIREHLIKHYVKEWAEDSGVATDIYVQYFEYNEGTSISAQNVIRVIEGVNKINELDLKHVPHIEFHNNSIHKKEDIKMDATYNVKYTLSENELYITGVFIKEI